jgi:hypothetical protein
VKIHKLHPHVLCHGDEASKARQRARLYKYVLRGALPPRYGHGYARHSTCMEDAKLALLMQRALYLECSDMP